MQHHNTGYTSKTSHATPDYDISQIPAYRKPIQNSRFENHNILEADYEAPNSNRSNGCPYLSMHPHLRKKLPKPHPNQEATFLRNSKRIVGNFLRKFKAMRRPKANDIKTLHPEYDPRIPDVGPRRKHIWFVCRVCRQTTRQTAWKEGNLEPFSDGRLCDGCAGELLAERELC